MNVFQGFDNKKDPTQRDYCAFVIFGDLGQGKSTYLRQFALMYLDGVRKKGLKRKVLIADPSNSSAFDNFPKTSLAQVEKGVDVVGGRVTKWTEGIRILRDVTWTNDTWFEVIQNSFKNGLLILDETRVYFKNGNLTPAQKQLFTIHRNSAIDLVCVSHNFMDLPISLRKQFRIYITFKTGDKPTNESWFSVRTLPEELYEQWRLLSRIIAPASKITPHYYFDSKTGTKKLYVSEDNYDDTIVVVSLSPRKEVTYRQFINQKLKII